MHAWRHGRAGQDGTVSALPHLGRVLELADEVRGLSAFVAHERHRQLDPDHAAVPTQTAILQPARADLRDDDPPHLLERGFHVVGMRELREAGPEKIFLATADDLAKRPVDAHDASVERDQRHTDRSAVDHFGKQLARPAQR